MYIRGVSLALLLTQGWGSSVNIPYGMEVDWEDGWTVGDGDIMVWRVTDANRYFKR